MKALEDYLNQVFDVPEARTESVPEVVEFDNGPAPSEAMSFIDQVTEFAETLDQEVPPADPDAELNFPSASTQEAPASEGDQEAEPEPEPEPEPIPTAVITPPQTHFPWQTDGSTLAMCLQVAGVRFAVPRAAVTQVMYRSRIEDDSQGDWHWGTVVGDDNPCVAIDTGWLFMGERYHSDLRTQYRKIILLGQIGIALAADAIDDEIEIPGDQVTWRDDTTHRPWLAGTWPAHPCALVDLTALINELLENQHEQ